MNSQKLYNRYDIGLILLIASLVVGDFFGALQPVRLVALIFMPQVLRHFVRINRFMNKIFLFFLFWLFYIIISLSWTLDLSQGLKEILYYISHFSLFLLIQDWAYRAINPLRSIIGGWLLFFLLTCPIAFYELIYDVHLPLSIQSSDMVVNLGDGFVLQKKFASVSFGSYNTYVTHLCFAMPFSFSFLLLKKNILFQCIGWASIMMMAYILLMNASRGGILCLVVVLFCLLYYYRQVAFKSKWIILFFVLFITIILIIPNWNVITEQFVARFVGKTNIFEDSARSNLISTAWNLFLESYAVGTGVGSIIAAMSTKTSGVIIPHNLFLELLVQYGLIIFIFCFCFIIRLFFNVFFSERRKTINGFILVSSFCSLPFVSVINSGYLLMPALWIYFSCLTFLSFSKRSKSILN